MAKHKKSESFGVSFATTRLYRIRFNRKRMTNGVRVVTIERVRLDRIRSTTEREIFMATETANAVYTAKTHTTGGRQGESFSSDGNLDIQLTPPGGNGAGTNPEQLFAAGWSACYLSAMGLVAGQHNVKLPADTA